MHIIATFPASICHAWNIEFMIINMLTLPSHADVSLLVFCVNITHVIACNGDLKEREGIGKRYIKKRLSFCVRKVVLVCVFSVLLVIFYHNSL